MASTWPVGESRIFARVKVRNAAGVHVATDWRESAVVTCPACGKNAGYERDVVAAGYVCAACAHEWEGA
jgi:acetyl-CoA carboxylase beta subunit